MQGEYQKIEVIMGLENRGYSFWKTSVENPVCRLESYKERRSIFFSVGNLLPGNAYHLILMGTVEGELYHQAFGPLQVGENGVMKYYKVFTGPELTVYQYCLLCAGHSEEEMEVVYRGELFPQEQTESIHLDALCKDGKHIQIFTSDKDETSAQWYRIDHLTAFPKMIESCRPWIMAYGHYIIGKKDTRYYVGIPGRFLQREQPLRKEGVFLLWQPIRGGEDFFERADMMTEEEQERIFGYWIAAVVEEGNRLESL